MMVPCNKNKKNNSTADNKKKIAAAAHSPYLLFMQTEC